MPPKTRWNGLPRVFVIQWRENVSGALWNNKTISKIGASEGNLTGLLATKEYFVRVKMCNGEKLCSEFSKEMFIDSLEENGELYKRDFSLKMILIIWVLSFELDKQPWNKMTESNCFPNFFRGKEDDIRKFTREDYRSFCWFDVTCFDCNSFNTVLF